MDKQTKNLPGFTKINDDTYDREVKVEGGRRYILCFNPRLFKDQHKARLQSIEEFRFLVKDLNTELSEAKGFRQRKPTDEKFKRGLEKSKLSDFVEVKLRMFRLKRSKTDGSERKVRTYSGTVVVDEVKMRLAGKLDGFWLLVTNHIEKKGELFNIPTHDTVNPYREKVIIEAAFRDIKSFVEVSPVYVWTETHVKAHYTICVLSHLINRTLTLRLHEAGGNLTRKVVSHEKLYKKLSGCLIDHIEVENVGLSTHNMTRPNSEQKELLGRLCMENLLLFNALEKM